MTSSKGTDGLLEDMIGAVNLQIRLKATHNMCKFRQYSLPIVNTLMNSAVKTQNSFNERFNTLMDSAVKTKNSFDKR